MPRKTASQSSPLAIARAILLLTLPLVSSLAAAQIGPAPGNGTTTDKAAPVVKPKDAPAGAQPSVRTARSAGGESRTETGWWNRRIGSELAITAAQREQLDQLGEKLGGELRTSHDKLRDVRSSLQTALEKSDWAAARKAYEAQATQSAANIRQQGEAQIAMLMLLTPTQRASLAAKHPNLLSSPMVRARGDSGPNRDAKAPPAGAGVGKPGANGKP